MMLRAHTTHRQTGFTMIEAMVYIGLLLVIISATTAFFFTVLRADVAARAERRAVGNAAFALTAVRREVRHAEHVYGPTSVFSDDAGQLSLRTPLENPNDHLVGYSDIYVDNGVLYLRRDDGSSLRPLTAGDVNVDTFRVEQYENGSAEGIRLMITVTPQGFRSTLAASRTVETFVSARVVTVQ